MNGRGLRQVFAWTDTKANRTRVVHHPLQVNLLVDWMQNSWNLWDDSGKVKQRSLHSSEEHPRKVGVFDEPLLLHVHQDLLPADGTHVDRQCVPSYYCDC